MLLDSESELLFADKSPQRFQEALFQIKQPVLFSDCDTQWEKDDPDFCTKEYEKSMSWHGSAEYYELFDELSALVRDDTELSLDEMLTAMALKIKLSMGYTNALTDSDKKFVFENFDKKRKEIVQARDGVVIIFSLFFVIACFFRWRESADLSSFGHVEAQGVGVSFLLAVAIFGYTLMM